MDGEAGDVRGQAAQAVDDGVRGEGAVLLRERDEGLGVERDAELLVQGVGERPG